MNTALAGSYDYRLVALSVVIAILASYAALDLAGRVTSARGGVRRIWLSGGAAAMGIGIWSMHYVGMLAFRLPVAVRYDWPTVLASLLAAIAASAVALYVVSRESMKISAAIVGSLCMGSAIAGMHYIGMAAMRLPAMCSYSPSIVAISVLLAVVISLVALFLAFRFRAETRSGGWQKALSAVVMGAAVPVMHYTGMAAATFAPSEVAAGTLSHALNISTLGVAGIIIVTFMVLGLTIVTSLVDRRFSAQALELEASEMRSRQILETSFDPFMAMDAQGRIIDWNAKAEVVFGWPRSEMLGKPFGEIVIPPNCRGQYEHEAAELLKLGTGGVSSRRFEITAVRRDAAEIPVEVTISATGRDNLQHLAAFVRDLSEHKRAEQALRTAKEAAEAASQAKSTFLATMSHEIRTPMNGILGMTELVLDTDLSREQRENLGLVRLSAESLLTIINDVLDFSKIEAGKLDLESIPFDLRESLGETMKSLGIRAHQKGLELVYEVNPDVPEALVGDPGRVRQILVNLVGNSVKFTERGEVFVSVAEESHDTTFTCLHFQVKDTGIGIAPDKQQKVFEAFSQADGSMARKYGGTGLGLAICTRLVNMMGGKIWVESELGHGTTFHFTLRLGFQENFSQRPVPLEPDQLRDLHVLVVDDNYTNRRVLTGMLTRWGMKPTAVEGGRAALQALQVAKSTGRPFPLILLDGQMPEIDGFALAEMIQKGPELVGATIMMLTSAGHLGDAARCRELGIKAYLVKPIRQGELLDGICNILRPTPQAKPELITRHTLRESKNRLRVLLAEDNQVNQTLAVRLLEKRGYTVRVAGNGREALETLEKESFDVVLMDVQMPEMDGFEATTAIRAGEKITGRHLPIVAMTAHALKGDEQRCLSIGMDAYVSKPIRTNELFAAIESVVQMHSEAKVEP
jgi:two-component system sensor histidine kinase/response regulator